MNIPHDTYTNIYRRRATNYQYDVYQNKYNLGINPYSGYCSNIITD